MDEKVAMLIRPFSSSRDIRACADIAIRCWNRNVADRVVEQISEGYYLVAEIEDVVVGLVGARKTYLAHNGWEIPWIAISPDHQGKQIGACLLQQLIRELNDVRRATLLFATTQRAHFFENSGFNVVETYNDGWCLMTMPLRSVGL